MMSHWTWWVLQWPWSIKWCRQIIEVDQTNVEHLFRTTQHVWMSCRIKKQFLWHRQWQLKSPPITLARNVTSWWFINITITCCSYSTTSTGGHHIFIHGLGDVKDKNDGVSTNAAPMQSCAWLEAVNVKTEAQETWLWQRRCHLIAHSKTEHRS